MTVIMVAALWNRADADHYIFINQSINQFISQLCKKKNNGRQ